MPSSSSPHSATVRALSDVAIEIDEAEAARHRKSFETVYPDQPLSVAIATLMATAYPALGLQLTADPTLLPTLQLAEAPIHLSPPGVFEDTSPEALGAWLRYETNRYKMQIAFEVAIPSSIGGKDPISCGKRISDLADRGVQLALDEAKQHIFGRYGIPRTPKQAPSQLVVLGMGKLGGQELNVGSDIDLVCFYDSDECIAHDDRGREHSAHLIWSKVVQRMTSTLEQVTKKGFVWRVDLRLRPEGSAGPLVNSLSAAERYYETFGRLWERGAMLRARPIAGCMQLGQQVLSMLEPFIWQRKVDPTIASKLYALVRRARTSPGHTKADENLKLGEGGIREAEFFVQTLQLIWGGLDPSLRPRPTLLGLARLLATGRITEREAHDLEKGYVTLRRTEHAIQFSTGLQTHELPKGTIERTRLARLLGFDTETDFLADLHQHRTRIAALFASLLPSTEGVAKQEETNPWQDALKALDKGNEEGFARAVERGWRWRGTETEREILCRELFALSRSPTSPIGPGSREKQRVLVGEFLDAVVDAANPTQAATYLRSLFRRLRHPGIYRGHLLRDGSAARRLITVLGGSAFVAEALLTRPDLVDLVLFTEHPVQAEEARAEVARETSREPPEGADCFEHHAGGLRRAKLRVTTAVALADLAETINTTQATITLSALAESTLDSALRFVLETPDDQEPRGLAILAMGKLGGREIGYGSDLDVVFVFDPDADIPDPVGHYSKCARKIISLIGTPHYEGPGYELDTRLRPSGSQGLLVTSIEAFARYHGTADAGVHQSGRAATWERLALLRARFVAGDTGLGQRAIAIAQRAAYEQQLDAPTVGADIKRLRERMEQELARERPGRYDLKFGRGGLLDIEFSVQLLQLRFGQSAAVRSSDTREALEGLRQIGALNEDKYRKLHDGYHFLRRVEQRLRIVHGDGAHLIEENAAGLFSLARRLGIHASPRHDAATILLQRYRATSDQIRTCYEEVLASFASS